GWPRRALVRDASTADDLAQAAVGREQDSRIEFHRELQHPWCPPGREAVE
ncbi:MAG: hypothetical protein HOP15_06920, partial [Planctomycetes bacterium]|nr:hypothetical protein [Planctomycetota bacterium]